MLLAPLLGLAWIATPSRANDLAVRRGQREADPARLPFVCFSVAVVGHPIPLDGITLVDLSTKKEIELALADSFELSHADYPTAIQGNRSLCLLVLPLKPGRYWIKQFEWFAGGTMALRLTFTPPSSLAYAFTVKPERVNYAGCVVIDPHFPPGGFRFGNMHSETIGFRSTWRIERTEARDYKWACDIIPAMAKLPPADSPFGR